jgi:hypothetical protein
MFIGGRNRFKKKLKYSALLNDERKIESVTIRELRSDMNKCRKSPGALNPFLHILTIRP